MGQRWHITWLELAVKQYDKSTVDGNMTINDFIRESKYSKDVEQSPDEITNYGGATRLQHDNSSYLYLDNDSFSIYLNGQKFKLLSNGDVYILEDGEMQQVATRKWVEEKLK